MIIDPNNTLGSGSATNRSRTGSGSNVQSPTDKPADSAKNSPKSAAADAGVVLSSEAKTLNRLEASISDTPDVDMDRVEQIKQAIAEGKFEINAERIAENMLKQDELLS